MSIRVMTIVMDMCVYQGGVLSTLLMMADHGNDQGENVFPQIDLLAAKTRMSERNVRGCIRALRDDLVVILLDDEGNDLGPDAIHQGGRGKWPQYRIDLERLKALQASHKQADPSCAWCAARAKRMKRATAKVENRDTKPGKIEHPHKEEPSGTVNNRSAGAANGKASKPKAERTVIGAWTPGDHERAKAIKLWTDRGRPDLVANIEIVVQLFLAHHRGIGSRWIWPDAWETWYVRALRDKPLPVTHPARIAAAEGATMDQWVWRLTAWFDGHPDDGVFLAKPKGTWDHRWGPKPGQPGCLVPPEALRLYQTRRAAGRESA